MTSEFGSFVSPCFVIIGFINLIFTVVNVVYTVVNCISLSGRSRGAAMTPSLWRRRDLGLRRFWLTRGENQDHRHHTDADGRANLLAQVHIITILSSLSSSLRSLVDDTQHTHNTQILFVFRVHFTFVYLRFCPESSPDVHLRRACSVSLPAALLWLPAKRRQQSNTTMPR